MMAQNLKMNIFQQIKFQNTKQVNNEKNSL